MTVSPLSGARDASPRAQISFLGAPADELAVLSVKGSRTGAHTGHLMPYSQGDGASFVPDRPFAEGERVTVRARLSAAGAPPQLLLDEFAVATEDPLTTTPEAIHPGSAAEVQGFRSRPDLQPPRLDVTSHAAGTAPGDLFVAPYGGPGQAGPMILDEAGNMVWFKPLPHYTSATDLRAQEYLGKPVLTWWQGDISVHGFGRGVGVIADSSYTDLATVRAGNGQAVDLHELQLTPAGTALITAYDPIHCNLSSVGGPAKGAVTDGVFQEIDVRTGLVMYEWTSLDHVALGDSYARAAGTSARWPFDFFHINSIDVDADGSLMISARNTWTIYGIDRASGQIAWRLGGRHSSFTAGPGTRTAYQHDPRQLASGLISVFDNGSAPTVHSQSRGVVLSLDAQTQAATLVAQFEHTPALISQSQGNIQALANGDWLVGWGQEPFFSEFSPSGALLFDAHFPVHEQSYRSFRFPWTGTPAHAPTYAFTGAPHGGTVYASWNGATQVASWRVLAGPLASRLRAVATVARAGFETPIVLPSGVRGPYLAVQALDAGGAALASSAAVAQSSLR